MSDVKSLSVIVPLYNEADTIAHLHEYLENCLQLCKQNYEIIYVDDGSTDTTFSELQNAVRDNPCTRIVQLSRNFGQTAALSAGIAYSNGSIVIFMDGDLQNDPQDIPRLLKKLEEGYDIVSGWRKQRKDARFSRKIPSWIANRLIAKVTGVPLHDFGCTLKAYRREIFQHVRLYGEMHRLLPAYAALYGARIAELEVAHHPRRFGSSKYGISRTIRVILDLVRLKFQASFETKPMHGFGIPGLLWLSLSFACFLFALASRLRSHEQDIKRSSFVAAHAISSLGFGSTYIFMGLLGELLMRIYYETQGRKPYVVRQVIPPLHFYPSPNIPKWKSIVAYETEGVSETTMKQEL
jgi:glycosyltransferase involved in cell wall biosynthesis